MVSYNIITEKIIKNQKIWVPCWLVACWLHALLEAWCRPAGLVMASVGQRATAMKLDRYKENITKRKTS